MEEILDTNFQVVHQDTTFSKAIGIMLKHKQFELPVVGNNGVLKGLLSYNSLAKSGSISMNEKVETAQLSIPKLKTEDNLARAAELFLSSDHRLLPVIKNRKVQGIVRRWKIIEMASDLKTWKKMNVTELMSRHVEIVKIDDKLTTARTLLRRLDIKTVPVVDKNGEIAGVIGIQDIISFLKPKRRPKLGAFTVEKTNFDPYVKDVMVTEPHYLTEESNIEEVISMMLKYSISTVIIVKDKKPTGIISGFDLLEHIMSAGRKEDSVFINISGFEEEDPEVMDSLFEILGSTMKKINKIFAPKVLNIHVHSYNIEGNEIKYSVNMRLTADKHLFVTKANDWDIYKAFSDGVDRLYSQVRKKKEILKEHKVR